MTTENDDALLLAEEIHKWNNPCARSAAHIRRLVSENEALRQSVKKANDQAEHFERQWYLRGDENEAQAALLRQAREALERIDACLEAPTGSVYFSVDDLFAAIDAQLKT